VLCCGGGIASVVGLVVTGTAAVNEQAHAAVEEYLQAVGDSRYSEAYRMLCRELRLQRSQRDFIAQVSEEPKVLEYELQRTRLPQNGAANDEDAVVPASVVYTDGTQAEVRYLVRAEGSQLRFCGTTG